MGSWLDEMPPVPLERSVPVVGGIVVDIVGDEVWVQLRPPAGRLVVGGQWYPLRDLRVDLDHPQGVAYALRRLQQYYVLGADGRESMRRVERLGPILRRWLCGETDDADRLVIARALREVA